MPRRSKYLWLVREVESNLCEYMSIHHISQRFNVPRDSVYYVLRTYLKDSFVLVGNTIISKCALERAREELQCVVKRLAGRGGFLGKTDRILEYVCRRETTWRALLHELMLITFPNAITFRNRIYTVFYIPIQHECRHCNVYTLRKLLCHSQI